MKEQSYVFRNISLVILLIVFAWVVATNFPQDGWLLGWDNIVPEFNFFSNFQRGLSVWQENQGLGVIGGHGFAATLPHTLIQYILSLFFQTAYLRPIFTLSMLLVGSLGCFFLTARIFTNSQKFYRYPLSLVAALYYMLNFGTVQMFYIPLEGFTFHFAFLPWLIFALIRYFELPSKKNLLLFVGLTLASTGQGFIPPLFVIYGIFLGIFCTVLLLVKRNWQTLKMISLILLITVLLNAYWLLPIGFYAKERSQIYLDSYNNLQTTDDFVYKSRKYGNLDDVVNLKGFIYEAIAGFINDKPIFIYQTWIDHIEQPTISTISYSFFAIILLGFGFAWRKKEKYQIILSICFLISFTFLASNVPPFSYISDILRNHLPVFKQAFRIAFTKFSISLALFYAIFLGIGLSSLLSFFYVFKTQIRTSLIINFILIILIIWTWPVFQGNFFYKKIRLNFPFEYLQLFEFFKSKSPTSKIANFPQISPAGWTSYSWEYIGSGFLWYGLSQPILDRNFDVWGKYNENYYWEISSALYAQNPKHFSSILDKYHIEWLVIDRSVRGFYEPKSVYIDELEKMLSVSPHISLEKSFGNIEVYHVSFDTPPQKNILLAQNLPIIEPTYKWNNFDKAYLDYGNYISSTNDKITPQNNIFYPFRSLFTGRKQNEVEFTLVEDKDEFIFKTQIPQQFAQATLFLPQLTQEDVLEIDENDFSVTNTKYPKIYIDDELVIYDPTKAEGNTISLPYIKQGKFEVRVPKIGGLYSFTTVDGLDKEDGDLFQCDNFEGGQVSYDSIVSNGKKILKLTALNSSNCFDKYLPSLSHRIGYLITVSSRNIEGKPLAFWLENQEARKAEVDTYIRNDKSWQKSFIIQAPLEMYGRGYTVHIKNTSIGDIETVNEIDQLSVHPIPYRFLSSLKIVKENSTQLSSINNQQLVKVDHPNPSYYQISIPDSVLSTVGGVMASQAQPATPEVSSSPSNNITLILSQSYDDGWKAYEISCQLSVVSCQLKNLFPFLFFKEIKDHVLVNNWENGWVLESSKINNENITIAIIYLPQYLEYMGFTLFLGMAIYLMFRIVRKDN